MDKTEFEAFEDRFSHEWEGNSPVPPFVKIFIAIIAATIIAGIIT